MSSELPSHAPATPPPLPKFIGAARPLPKWAWIVAVLLFPTGIFVAFGASRLLSWPRSIALAVLSYVTSFTLFGKLIEKQTPSLDFQELFQQLLQSTELASIMDLGAKIFPLLAGQLLVVAFWGYVQYRIGERAAFWPPLACKLWRRSVWVFAGLFVALLVLAALTKAATHLQIPDL